MILAFPERSDPTHQAKIAIDRKESRLLTLAGAPGAIIPDRMSNRKGISMGSKHGLIREVIPAQPGFVVLYSEVNPLTMWLTLATFVGYAVVYTVLLKPMTPQNIVIGGASGAMPPVLGWAAVTGDVPFQALLLFLIIFAWTPPHFWALALYRKNEYAKAGVPMLPVTHGDEFTRLHVLLYTVILIAVTLLPFATRMSGVFYLVSVLLLDAVFLYYAIRIYRDYSDRLAQTTFRYSILYLMLLFTALLLDHYISV